MLNLVHARTFLTIVETRGVRSAARLLELAPSTIIDHIRQLEEELAVPLLDRQTREARTTAEGERFLPIARALVETAERAPALLSDRRLRIVSSSNVGIYMLQPSIADFQTTTGVTVETWIGPNPDAIDRMGRGEADLAVLEWWDERKGFSARTWACEPLVIIVAPGHRWGGLDALTVDELLTEPLLGGEPGTGTGRLLRQQLGPLADRLMTIGGLGSTEAVKRAVRAGRGASVVMRSAVSDEIAARQLVALSLRGIALSKEIKMVVPEALPSTAPAMRFFADTGPERSYHVV